MRLKRLRKNPNHAARRSTSLSLLQSVCRVGALEDGRVEERDEDRSCGLHALASDLDDVTHLVDEDHRDERDREPGSVEDGVAAEADHQRDERSGERDLEEEQQAYLP